ncbi:MAG: tRNA (adenosine(37)-N6)-threonylcarbamoyltransferase complex transferase subunit TsaD [Spirochaetales bacterium]|nr:tRNA (adenosine(37)-N6)-threonylcarbamoyltransferase complex transferase subunit TsaD [Spirochaetales bacterium]
MKIIGIETSCDECSVAVVEDGKRVLSNVVATQLDIHRPFNGVVPEIASRTHTEWIWPVVMRAIADAGIQKSDIDGVAVTNRPGLVGSLLVGLSFAKGFAYAISRPLIAVDHILAHIYAAHLEHEIAYPYLGLIASGGHTIISRMDDFDAITVLGTTIDDACGEAFDKVAKHYGFGYPGGLAIDKLARMGNRGAYNFPDPSLHKGEHTYDVSYSGLKTAVINQLHQFKNDEGDTRPEDIAASFEKAAIDMLMKRVSKALRDEGLQRLVAGGGVAANTYLREIAGSLPGVQIYFPSLKLCTDNGAMVAGIGYHYLRNNLSSSRSVNAYSRVDDFKKSYP